MGVGELATVGVRWVSAAIVITLAALFGTILGTQMVSQSRHTDLMQDAMDDCVAQARVDALETTNLDSLEIEPVRNSTLNAYRVVSPYWTCMAYPMGGEKIDVIVYPPRRDT